MTKKAKKKLIDYNNPPKIGTVLETNRVVDGKRVPAFVRLRAIQVREKKDRTLAYQLVWQRDDGAIMTSGLRTPLRLEKEWCKTDIAWLRAILKAASDRDVTMEELEVMARASSSAKGLLCMTRKITVID